MGLLAPTRLSAEEAEEIIQGKLRWILEACDPSAVIVFGSAARGEMTEASDIDMVLVFPDEEAVKKARSAIYGRPPAEAWPADILLATEAGFKRRREAGGLYELVAREGRLIAGEMP